MADKKRTSKYKKHVGLAPGTLVYTGTKTENELFIECIDYSPTHLDVVEHNDVSEVFQFKSTNSNTWININGLNHTRSIEAIGEHYQISPLILEDIVNTSQRPKIDLYEDYIFVSLKMIYYDKDESIVIEQVSLILGDNYVLSFQETEGDVFESLRKRMTNVKGRLRTLGTDYLFYTLIDSVVDHYYKVTETMSNKIEDMEDDLFLGHTSTITTQQIQSLKKELLRIRRSISPLREIINRIEISDHKLIDKKNLQYFMDVYDHIIQLSESVDIYREMIWGLMDMYMTSISNKMNEVMKVLTIIATIFIPLTFITGIYGMNFNNMPELRYQNGYYAVLGLMVLVFIIMIVYFKRKKWL